MARRMARSVAPRMLCCSISSTGAEPKCAWIRPWVESPSNSPQSASRCAAVSSFESLTRPDFAAAHRPSRNARVTRTAPATTGPASAPRPTSSTPIRLSKPSIFFRSKLRSWRRFGMARSRGASAAPLHLRPRLAQRELVQLARGGDHLVGRPEMQLREVAQCAGAELLYDLVRLHLDERAGALLQ